MFCDHLKIIERLLSYCWQLKSGQQCPQEVSNTREMGTKVMRNKTVNFLIVIFCIYLSPALVHATEKDYMSTELRQQVEELKRAYKADATTAKTYEARATVAWSWLNAYALKGGTLPVNITQTIRPKVQSKRSIKGIDYYLNELTLLDEEPAAIGELVADLGPFEARTYATFRQQYHVGGKGITTGGGFLIAKHWIVDMAKFQVEDPKGDNYLSVSSNNPNVTFAPDEIDLAGMHGGFGSSTPATRVFSSTPATRVFRVKSGELRQGDVVTVTYGDKSSGGRGLLMGTASTDFLPLPIYVDFDGSDQFVTLPIQPISVSGTSIAGVHGFSPSVVRPGESFELSVRAQDRFYNRAKAPIPAFEVFANENLIATVAASNEAITVIKDVQFAESGVYRISIRSADGSITGVGNPILVSADASKVFWGDTHGHSGFAEGIGSADRFMTWAKDDARLDFVTHSEHDIWMDDYEWQVLIDNVSKYSEPGRFIGYLGYEWTTQNTLGGHHNVLFRNVDQQNRIANQLYPTLSKLYAGLRSDYDTADVLVIPHAHQAGDYRQSDPELENLVEIMSEHGTFEWFGRMYLNHGHRVGFIAASDNHFAQPGYTNARKGQRGGLAGVWASDNSRDGIFDAMKSLQTYATTGDRMILDFRLNEAKMGQQAKFATERKISGRVIGTTPIESISLIKNDKEIWHKDYLKIDSGRYHDEENFQVTFESPSFPMHPNDNPRGIRGWIGTLRITGADIVSFSGTDFFNVERHSLELDKDNPQKIHFATGSRGDTSSIKLKLKNIKRNAKVTLNFEPTKELGGGRFRKPAFIPGSKVVLAFNELVDGKTRQVMPIDDYNDTVTLRRVVETGPDDVSFQIEDTGNIQGDYYFVRVKQANDASAWSSPIWVGGIPPR